MRFSASSQCVLQPAGWFQLTRDRDGLASGCPTLVARELDHFDHYSGRGCLRSGGGTQCHVLTDDQWASIEPLIDRSRPGPKPKIGDRAFIERHLQHEPAGKLLGYAVAESFFSNLKTELVYRSIFLSRGSVKTRITEWIEASTKWEATALDHRECAASRVRAAFLRG